MIEATFILASALATSVAIASPQAQETVFSNPGNVAVTVTTDAPLARGEQVELWVDGAPMPPARAARSFALSGLTRGRHTVQASLTGPHGETIARSNEVAFYVWKASRLFPNRRGG